MPTAKQRGKKTGMHRLIHTRCSTRATSRVSTHVMSFSHSSRFSMRFTSSLYSSSIEPFLKEREHMWDAAKHKAKLETDRTLFSHPQLITLRMKISDQEEPFEKQVQIDSNQSVVSPLDICQKFMSRNVAKDIVVCRINDDSELFDIQRPLIEYNGQVQTIQFYTFNDVEGIEVFWHSSAHLLGLALEKLYRDNGVKLCDGPPLINRSSTITSNTQLYVSGGFFYESYINNDTKQSITSNDLIKIEEAMTKFVSEKHPFERLLVSRDFAKKMFEYNQFKLDIIDKIPENEPITIYKCGDLIDLCRGPHIPNTGLIKAFKLNKVSGAYWQGNENNPILQRVYGIAFPNATMLKDWQTMIEEASKRDHRVIGKAQDLFVFHEWSPGTPFFLPHGARLFNKFVTFLRKEYATRGYDEVISPQMYNKELWQVSGHWQHYKDDMFTIGEEKEEEHSGCAHHAHSHNHHHEVMGLKPMNCPGHCLLFSSRTHSYKDLPIRWADFSPLHRNEVKGALSGLTRVRRFHQDDAHIFCTREQVSEEIRKCLDFVKYVYSIFGMKIILKLSTRPEKFVGSIDLWDEAEATLKQCLHNLGEKWFLNEGDGAFYGPKIDISIEDSLQRQHQCATIQLDFQLPQRFNLKYHAEDDAMHTPVMIHRAILGSIERFIAVLTEHLNGKWPFWISPRQCVIIPVSDQYVEYARQVESIIQSSVSADTPRFFIDIDDTEKTLKKKIRDAQLSQYNYMLVVGEQEMKDRSVNVRIRDGGQNLGSMSIDQLVQQWMQHISQFQ